MNSPKTARAIVYGIILLVSVALLVVNAPLAGDGSIVGWIVSVSATLTILLCLFFLVRYWIRP
jgi:hypothetical protein